MSKTTEQANFVLIRTLHKTQIELYPFFPKQLTKQKSDV
jgi:hypothetical protein